MSLFGGITPQARSRNLVEFKAGKMNLRGNMVYPDKRKGLLYVYQGNDLLMHLCWKDRSSNTPEEDLVIFPDEIEFKKVTQNTTGRVFILKWKNNARKFFFWMQEPKDDKDEEYCKKVNDLLNHPPAPTFGDDSGTGGNHLLQPLMERMAGGGPGGIDPSDLSNVLGSMNPREFASLLSSLGGGGSAASLMQGLHRSGGGSSGNSNQHTADSRPNTAPASTHSGVTTSTSTSRSGAGTSSKSRNGGTSSSSSAAAPRNTAAPTTSTAAKSSPIQIGALTSVLANLSSTNSDRTESTGAASQPAIDLCDIMANENLIPLLSNKDVQDKISTHLPEGTTLLTTEKELKEAVQSPLFRQIVTAFSAAIQARELGSVLTQFGLSDEVLRAANQGDLQAFTQALEKHYKKSTEEKPSDATMDTS